MTGMTIRMPSVLFALAGLGCIVSVARKFYSDRTAYLAGWLLLSTFKAILAGIASTGDDDFSYSVLWNFNGLHRVEL